MKRTLLSFFFACVATLAFSQLNMTLLDQIDYSSNANDVWGWYNPDDGKEYALVGLVNGFSIVDVTDPEEVQEVQFIPGPNSTWRDIKTWGNHVYVTNETNNGVLVVDMTNAPDNITWFDWTPNIPGLGTLSSCHNIYIDEFGFAYLAGCNLNSGGMLIIDVHSDPGNPQFEAAAPAVYSHDVYTRDNFMYASEIYQGRMAIYDVSDKSNITLEATQVTPFEFTHNIWLNDAGDVAFTTDEKGNAPVAAYDISDLDNIVELDQFVPVATMGENVIPHNVHVWDDWLIVSYYTDGGIIADASRPDNIIEVGNWDTFLGGNGGFSGVWGAYPFLPSGLVLLTDIGTGLYVCGADYVRACWLEGTVTDAMTGDPIFGADVEINSSQANFATSDLTGKYQTGQAIPGTFDVTFSAIGYVSKTVQAELENGELTMLDVELEPLSSFSVSGQVIKASDGSPIEGAQVFVTNDVTEYIVTTDASGAFSLNSVLGGDYTVYAAVAWGYLTGKVSNVSVTDATPPIVIELEEGYQDDFALDFGWAATGNASSGDWELGEPIGTTYNGAFSNPEVDVNFDLGDQCYVTGNGGGGAGDDDVDNGTVTLTSPPMDLTSYNAPKLSFAAWFYNDGGNGSPNDEFEIRVTNGSEEVVLGTIANTTNGWVQREFSLGDFIDLTDNVRVVFETYDLNGGHLVEAAVDAFLVEESVVPTAGFSADVTSGCAPLEVQFTDESEGSPSTWEWNFPGGNPELSNEQNPTVTYNEAGTFDVRLVASNAAGESEILQSQVIVVDAAPTVGFDFVLNGNEVVFTNGTTNADSYEWQFGDAASSSSDEESPTFTYSGPGEYDVTLTAENDCGISASSQTVVIEVSSTLGLDENAFTLTATPNPFTDQLTINYELMIGFEKAEIQVFNLLGEQMATFQIENAMGTLSLENEITLGGMYFLQISVDGKAGKALRLVKI